MIYLTSVSKRSEINSVDYAAHTPVIRNLKTWKFTKPVTLPRRRKRQWKVDSS